MLAILLLVATGAAAAQSSPPRAVEELLRLVTPTGTRISPDGRTVLYTAERLDSTGRYVEGIRSVSIDGGASRTLVERGFAPRWHPQGRGFAHLASAGGATQLFLRDTSAGPGTQLTRLPHGVTDFAWSPDGTRIALTTLVAGAAPDTVTRVQIFLLDPASLDMRQLTRSRRQIIVHVWDPDANLSWSPDGSRIAYSEKPSSRFDDDYASDVFAVGVTNGVVRQLTTRSGMDMRPVWSPDGRHIAFRSSFGSVDRYGDHGLAVVDTRSSQIRDVGREFQGGFLDGPHTYAWARDGRLLFLGAQSKGVSLFAIDVARGTTTRLTVAPAKRAMLSVAERADALAMVVADSATPWEVYAVAGSPPARRLTRHGAGLEEGRFWRARTFEWTNAGWRLDGTLLIPDGTAPRDGWPLITVMHGGPEGQAMLSVLPELPSPLFESRFNPVAPHLLAAEGLAVFVPNFRGSGGHGREYRRAGLVNWTQTFIVDVMSGVDSLVAAGIADSTRLGLIGERSGGAKAVSLLAFTKRFRAAVVSDAHIDFVLEFNQLDDFRSQWIAMFGGTPTSAPEQYRLHSPINHASRITTPLYILANERAFAAPVEQSLELHRILARSGTSGELHVYRGRTLHDDLDVARRVASWFGRWLGN